MIESILFFCAVTSLACTVLLLRGYRRSRCRMLCTGAITFALLAANASYLFVDVIVLPDVDLNGVLWRSMLHAASAVILIGGIIVEMT